MHLHTITENNRKMHVYVMTFTQLTCKEKDAQINAKYPITTFSFKPQHRPMGNPFFCNSIMNWSTYTQWIAPDICCQIYTTCMQTNLQPSSHRPFTMCICVYSLSVRFLQFNWWLAYGGKNRDGYRDQIVTCDVGASLHSKTHPLFMWYSNGTKTHWCAYQYLSLFPVLFLQSLYVPF